MRDLSQCLFGKTERVGEMTAPPGAERHFGDARAVMRMHHGVGRGRNRAMLGGAMIAPSEQQHVAAADFRHVDLDEMPARRHHQRVGARFRPIRRIGRRQFGLFAQDLAPNTAQQTEAIATDAFARGLMPIRRANP